LSLSLIICTNLESGNRIEWIVEAIDEALLRHASEPLDVVLVHYGSRVKSEFSKVGKPLQNLRNANRNKEQQHGQEVGVGLKNSGGDMIGKQDFAARIDGVAQEQLEKQVEEGASATQTVPTAPHLFAAMRLQEALSASTMKAEPDIF